MQETVTLPPRTVMEVFKMLPEGTLAEVIENTLYMSPAPTWEHQELLFELALQLSLHCKRMGIGKISIAPVDVYLDENSNAVQPDIFLVVEGNSKVVRRNGAAYGVPDMIIEVLSPGNKNHDTVLKKNLYEKFGVKEYWVIDPDTRASIGYTLKNSTYQLIGEDSGKINSVLLGKSFVF